MTSSTSPRTFSRRIKESDHIYLAILSIEEEKRKIKAAKEASATLALTRSTASTFLSLMAKRKERLEGDTEKDTPTQPLISSLLSRMTPESSNCNNNRSGLHISIPIEGGIPHISGLGAIPPEPVATPIIVCPKGLKGFKFVDVFELRFSEAECCGGPRNVQIHAANETTDNCLCLGRIDSETAVLLQREKEDKEMEEVFGMKFDETTSEWSLSFPELETVAYMVKPKPGSRVSAAQVYEIFSAEGCSNYFNLGVESEKKVSNLGEEWVFRILNSSLETVGSVALCSDFKEARVEVDGSLWPSQKAVILAVGLYMAWDVVQEIRRKSAWFRVIIAGGIVLIVLLGVLMVNIYLLKREE